MHLQAQHNPTRDKTLQHLNTSFKGLISQACRYWKCRAEDLLGHELMAPQSAAADLGDYQP